MSYTEMVLYLKPSRSLQTVSEASHILRFPSLAKDLRKIAVGLRMMELVDAVVQEEEQSPGMFNLTLETLQRLSLSTRRIENLLPYFELRMASQMGFAPLIRKDQVEDVTNSGGYLALDNGAITSGRSGGHGLPGSRKALRAFAILASADIVTVQRMTIDGQTRSEVDKLIEAFMRFHLEESYPVRTRRVLGQMAI